MCFYNDNYKKWCREIILDHYNNSRNKKTVHDDKFKNVVMVNPSCGDSLSLQVFIDNNIIKEAFFNGEGCSICCSSSSILIDNIKNKSIDEVKEIIESFYNMLNKRPFDKEILKEAICLEGVSKLPARIKCATLAYEALHKIIK